MLEAEQVQGVRCNSNESLPSRCLNFRAWDAGTAGPGLVPRLQLRAFDGGIRSGHSSRHIGSNAWDGGLVTHPKEANLLTIGLLTRV